MGGSARLKARAIQVEEKTRRRAYGILIAAVAFEYLRPQDLISPVIGMFRIPMMLTILLLIYAIKNFEKITFDAQLKFAAVFLGLSMLWIPFAVNNYYAFHSTINLLVYFISILISVKLLCDTEERVLKFVKHWTIVMTLLALIVITHNGHGPGSFLWDENDVCTVMVAAIPFAFWARKHIAKTAMQRWMFFAFGLLLILAATFTRSRGGFLGLAASLLVLWWYSRNRVKTAALVAVAALVFGSAILAVLPKGYLNEMQTIQDPNDSTRKDRIKHWVTAWEMYKDNIVFGVGPGNYPWHHQEYVVLTKYYDPHGRQGAGRQSHSLYFTLFPELGSIGVVAFFGMLFASWKRLRFIRSTERSSATPAMADLATATIASTAGILISGAFISILWYPTAWQWLIMYWAVDSAYRSSQPGDKEPLRAHQAVAPMARGS